MSRRPAWFPDERQQWLLEACLLEDEARARESLGAWSRHVDIEHLDSGSYRLLPLLWRRLPRIGPGHPSHGLLKGVYRRTWYANQIAIARVSPVLAVLRDAGIKAMVLKGVPLGLEAYRDVGARPMSDGDIAVPRAAARRAVEVLVATGFRPGITPLTGAMVAGSVATARWTVGARPLAAFDEAYFGCRHAHGFSGPEGFNLDLHWAVFQEGCERGADDAIWSRAHPLDVRGEEALAPSPADHLLLLLAHGARWNPIPPIRWVADAVVLLRSAPPSWPVFLDEARRRGLVYPTREMLGWLESHFAVGVPADVLASLKSLPVSRAEERAWSRRADRPGIASGVQELVYLWKRHGALRRDPGAGPIPAFAPFVRHVLGAASLVQVGVYAAGESIRRLKARA